MRYKDDFDLFVLIGGWNIAIFNPKWVRKYLFPDEEIKVEFSLDLDRSIKISTKEISISVISNKLRIGVISPNDQIIEKAQTIAIKIAEYLPHTPIIAFGLNYVFVKSLDDTLNKQFQFKECNIDNLEGAEVINTQLINKYKYKGHTYQLNVSRESEEVSFSFNIQYDVNNLQDFVIKIKEFDALQIKNTVLNMESEFFNIELDE